MEKLSYGPWRGKDAGEPDRWIPAFAHYCLGKIVLVAGKHSCYRREMARASNEDSTTSSSPRKHRESGNHLFLKDFEYPPHLTNGNPARTRGDE